MRYAGMYVYEDFFFVKCVIFENILQFRADWIIIIVRNRISPSLLVEWIIHQFCDSSLIWLIDNSK